MSRIVSIAKNEPAAVVAVVQTLIALLVQFGFTLTPAETGGILAATSAALGLIAAIATRPFVPAAATGLLTALGTVLVAFGVPHVSSGMVSGLNALILAVFALAAVRPQVTPVATLKAKARAAEAARVKM